MDVVTASVVIALAAVLVLGTLLLTVGVALLRWRNDRRSPVLTEPATVVAKRQQTRRTASAITDYFVTFQVRGGERIEFPVEGRAYGLLVERDRGRLTYQGSRFRDFVRAPQDV